MKHIISTLTLITIMAAIPAYAEESIPRKIHFQAIVTDDGGNVIPAEVQSADFFFRIKDGEGSVLYSESQNLPVVRGMISTFIGEGSEEGISPDVFAPDGSDRILEFQMDGHSVPQETVLMTSAPYAYYAEGIAGGIDSEDINDGEIGLADLSEDVQALLTATDETGEPITTLDAAQVSFSAAIANGTGTDMESLIQSIDDVITGHADRMDVIETNITNIQADTSDIENRLTTAEGEIDTLQTTVSDINNIPGTLGESKIDSTIARDAEIVTDHGSLTGLSDDDHPQYFLINGTRSLTGDLNAGGNDLTNVNISGASITSGTVDASRIDSDISRDSELDTHAADTSTHGVSGNIVGTSSTQTLTNKTLGTTTVTGDLTINSSNIVMDDPSGCTAGVDCNEVDGVDVSNLNDRVDSLETASIDESDLPVASRPLAYGRCNNLSTDTVDEIYNIDHTTRSSHSDDCDENFIYEIVDNEPTDTNYIVMITPTEFEICTTIDKTNTTFRIDCNGSSTGYEFVVFYNP